MNEAPGVNVQAAGPQAWHPAAMAGAWMPDNGPAARVMGPWGLGAPMSPAMGPAAAVNPFSGAVPPPVGHGVPPGYDPYWAAYHARAQAACAPPAPMHMGMPHPEYPRPPDNGAAPAQPGLGGHGHGYGSKGPGMSELVDEIAHGGNGLSSLSKMLNLDDSEFWKGALVGAAAVLLLTNESVQNALFKTGAKAKSVVQTGVDRVKEGPQRPRSSAPEESSDV